MVIFRADTDDFQRKWSFTFLIFALALTKRGQPGGLDRLMVPVWRIIRHHSLIVLKPIEPLKS